MHLMTTTAEASAQNSPNNNGEVYEFLIEWNQLQGILKVQMKPTGTFARNTSLRTEYARPSYIKGSKVSHQNKNLKLTCTLVSYINNT